MLSRYPWELCPFLNTNGGGVDWGWEQSGVAGEGSEGEEGEETVARM